ncbi:MAG: carboxypeptidase regulatory-like domain-containing protein [Candidatus Wallbacteria bacterium]|nr:carboxypeptidase regulatory-like domain-containing protein [Candidatus Wallbacteria bacterium]
MKKTFCLCLLSVLLATQQLSSAPSLRAEVLSADDSLPLKGAVVIVNSRRSFTDKNGCVLVTNLPYGQLIVEVQAPDYKTLRSTVWLGEQENYQTFSLNVQKILYDIHGTIKDDAREQPLPAALVRVGPHGVRCDSGGSFTLKGLAAGEYELSVRLDQFKPLVTKITVDQGNRFFPLRLSPLSGLGTVSGKLLSAVDRLPVAQARICISGQETSSDENGDFMLNNILQGEQEYIVTANGYQQVQEFYTQPTGVYEMTLFLVPASSLLHLTGKVLTAAGDALNGAEITAGGRKDLSDEAGDFEFPVLPSGITEITASMEGYLPYKSKTILTQGTDFHTIVLQEKPDKAMIKFRVLDRKTGSPVNAASVRIGDREILSDVSGTGVIGDLSPSTLEVVVDAANFLSLSETVRVSAGTEILSFHLDSLPRPAAVSSIGKIEPDSSTILFSDIESQGAFSAPAPPPTANRLQPPHVETNSAVIEGLIVSENSDLPVPGAVVVIGSSSGRADSSGRYSLTGVEHGLHDVVVLADNYKVFRSQLRIRDSRVIFNLKLSGEAEFLDVSGRIVSTGEVSAFKVRLNEHTAGVSGDGTFSFSRIKRDFYNVSVLKGNRELYRDQVFINEENSNLKLEF